MLLHIMSLPCCLSRFASFRLVFESLVWSSLFPFLDSTGTATSCPLDRFLERLDQDHSQPDRPQPTHKKTSCNQLQPVLGFNVSTDSSKTMILQPMIHYTTVLQNHGLYPWFLHL